MAILKITYTDVKNLNREIELKESQLNNLRLELENGFDFIPVTKKKYNVGVRYEKIGVKVYNKLENTNYITTNDRPLVLTGLVGEEWVIDAKTFMQTYVKTDGGVIDFNFIEVLKDSGKQVVTEIISHTIVWAKQVPVNIQIELDTLWGDILIANRGGVSHGNGDFIMAANTVDNKPSNFDRWIVNGEIFGNTYQNSLN
jgi:hypothetical protein